MKLRWFFVFFFVSGMCSLLYEVIWLRLGMAHFGVTTPLISIFLSLFMAGLGFGSWGFGKLIRRWESTAHIHPLQLYALIELVIGISAIMVPIEMTWANHLIDRFGTELTLSSDTYYPLAGALLALILLPWCTAMGATFPLAMAAIRRSCPAAGRQFSFLYLSNVLGAILGTLLPAFVLVELFGFRASLKIGAAFNLGIACAAFLFSLRPGTQASGDLSQEGQSKGQVRALAPRRVLLFLFLTGLFSMAMEVVWIRQFTPYAGTQVYAFAGILAVYLAGTFAGSRIYRQWIRRYDVAESRIAWILLGLAGLFPLLLADPRLPMMAAFRVILGIVPFAGIAGFVTPMLVDHFSQDNPDAAGRAYAINLMGCIVGPLIAGFLLLPELGERWSLIVLSLPLFALILLFKPAGTEGNPAPISLRFYAETAAVALALILLTHDFEQTYSHREVQRDYAATIISTGEGLEKKLVVNGVDITIMTPVTKMMAHLPLAFLNQPPKDALVICFGMGTTHRSLLSWNIDATAVELLPSVPRAFHYYHSDGDRLLQSAKSHLVIDDGRLFLERTNQQFDVITVDPPPPIQAAGVSLLYSREFYALVKKRLRPGGILHQWTIGGDYTDLSAITRALQQSFPYVRAFISQEGWGFHYIASMSPIPRRSAAELARRLPPSAVTDLLEWGPGRTAEEQFYLVTAREIAPDSMIAMNTFAPPMQDDRPVNEYWLLRSKLPKAWGTPLFKRVWATAGVP